MSNTPSAPLALLEMPKEGSIWAVRVRPIEWQPCPSCGSIRGPYEHTEMEGLNWQLICVLGVYGHPTLTHGISGSWGCRDCDTGSRNIPDGFVEAIITTLPGGHRATIPSTWLVPAPESATVPRNFVASRKREA